MTLTSTQPSMLPPLPDISEIHRRLQIIFPEGAPQRSYCVREMAARTIFVMLYVGAVEGSGLWIGPKHVYRMGDAQSRQRENAQRQSYMTAIEKRDFVAPTDRWFQDNTRESIRDETLRKGLVKANAVVTRGGLATASSKGRYALQGDFAALFDPALRDEPLDAAIATWRDRSFSVEALARARRQRIESVGKPHLPEGPIVPDQSPAPVCVEERAGKISRITDRDSPLGAPERDFNQWREPVFDHIQEMLTGDFRAGTNHSRARDRLVALAALLTGDTLDVKERQFRVGYEIERLGRLVIAYRTGVDDMPRSCP